jgi:hypothetical protein
MPIYDQTQLENITPHVLGIRVDSAAALITAAAVTKFTVSGGNVLMTWFYGEVKVVFPATNCTLGLIHTPTTGAASTIATSAGGTDIVSAAAGMFLQLPAVLAGTLTLTATAYAVPLQRGRYILRPGALSITGSAAPATGTIAWTMFYVPVDPGAYVTGS